MTCDFLAANNTGTVNLLNIIIMMASSVIRQLMALQQIHIDLSSILYIFENQPASRFYGNTFIL